MPIFLNIVSNNHWIIGAYFKKIIIVLQQPKPFPGRLEQTKYVRFFFFFMIGFLYVALQSVLELTL